VNAPLSTGRVTLSDTPKLLSPKEARARREVGRSAKAELRISAVLEASMERGGSALQFGYLYLAATLV